MNMFIGIDLGTSGVKCIIVNQKGEVLRTESRSYDLLVPKPSWTEQNPMDWYDQTIDALKELVIGYEKEIKGISFSGQMHGLVLLDKHDKVLRNALLWNDQRTIKEVNYLNETIKKEVLLDLIGNIALTGLTAPKLLWVRNNEPEIFNRIDKIMLPKDFLIYMLSGSFASDVSDLSGTLYFDPKTRGYSEEMLRILGINRNMLPSVHESYEVVGLLQENIKNMLNIQHDVQIVAGGGDQAVGAIGTGVTGDGECSISLGTSGVIFVAAEQFKVDHQSYLQSYAHANGKYHIMAVMLNAAGAIKWWNESIFDNTDYDAYYKNVESSALEDNLFFLPYLTGERAPINDPLAKGVLYGLGIHHTKKDIDKAVVEGVTFALRDSFELINKLGIEIKRVRVTGGGAKSNVWAQLISDIFNVEVVKIIEAEGPALGAAILAMVGCGVYDNVDQACKEIVKLGGTFKPNLKNVSFYQKKYQQFIKLYPVLKDLYQTV
jgi:xylulokinase